MKIMNHGQSETSTSIIIAMITIMITVPTAMMLDTNDVYSPCSDAKVQRMDGFTFGIAFSAKDNFFHDQIQLSPCDNRLTLSNGRAQLAIFRPKVDEISLLSIDNNASNPVKSGGYMVAFAGLKYAARSQPVLVADETHTITSFTLVLEFERGTLQNLYWKKFGCDKCSGEAFVCLNNQDCGILNSKCKSNGGTFDCNLSIQLAFSGTDKNLDVLNSWYEVNNLRQYSLFGLFNDVRHSLLNKYSQLF